MVTRRPEPDSRPTAAPNPNAFLAIDSSST